MALEDRRKELLDSTVNRKKLGGKRFHSESELQQYGEDEEANATDNSKDPGVLNASVGSNMEVASARQRAVSQPGPLAGNLVTASATRANRRRPVRTVNYADNLEASDSADGQPPKFLSLRGDDSGTATPNGDRASPSPYFNNYRNGDAKSLNSYRLYTPAGDGRGGTTPRKRSVATMDAQSIRSVETQAPPPTNPEDNKKLTMKYLSLLLSAMYAVLLVTMGLLCHIGDVFIDVPLSAYYSIALIAIGFFYNLYLVIDIQSYKNAAQKNQKLKAVYDDKMDDYFRKQEEDSGMNTPGDRSLEYRGAMPPAMMMVPLKHTYCFSQGRHSGSFYLKIGAAAFAMGHLIHSVLLITVQIGYLFDQSINNDDCVVIELVVLDFLSPVYSFFQLYFIFKYSNVIILKNQSLAHFGFMHMIGSSLCFWISTIVRETILALTLYVNSRHKGDYANSTAVTLDAAPSSRFNIDGLYNPECIGAPAINTIVDDFSPYLYPFSVEFNILIVAVYYIIWTNIGNCENVEGSMDDLSLEYNNTICKIPTAHEDNDFTSNIVIYADCHASNRGLFGGLILIVVVAGSLIIGFVFSSVEDEFYLEIGYTMSNSVKLALHVVMLISVVFAYNQTRKLDINEHSVSLLDDILLFICLPAFFMETALSMVATISTTNLIRSIDFVIMVLQVIIQTPLIMDALRRCSNSRKLRRTKPGRELLMFLIISNVAMWLFNTFSYKSPDSMDERYEYYGKVMWSILGHVSLPLIMFYRFHSSVCFADIWDSAYKPGAEH